MGRYQKKDGTMTVKGADGRITGNVAAAGLAGPNRVASVRAAAETGDWEGFFDSMIGGEDGLTDEERRIRELEDEGIPTSDAQAIVEAEALLGEREESPELWAGPRRVVVNESGRAFVVRFIPVGGRYGRGDALVNEKEPMVAFYDASYVSAAWPLGQFVSSYYASTLLMRPGSVGLCLDGGNADVWSLSAANVRDAVAFVEEQLRA